MADHFNPRTFWLNNELHDYLFHRPVGVSFVTLNDYIFIFLESSFLNCDSLIKRKKLLPVFKSCFFSLHAAKKERKQSNVSVTLVIVSTSIS